MMLDLPPGFTIAPERGVPESGEADPFAFAMADAAAGADPARVHWAADAEACGAAIVLRPDQPVSPETLGHLALLAAYDALASLAPPQVPVDLSLPATLLIDGARAGRVRTVQGPGEVPEWAVIGVTIALRSALADPGEAPGVTSLAEEGFEGVTASDVVSMFCRHLLVWVDVWQDEGAPALAHGVRQRLPRCAA